jgi:DNA-directed RNA polymerase subunit M/transcription elongation factor TFIIS
MEEIVGYEDITISYEDAFNIFKNTLAEKNIVLNDKGIDIFLNLKYLGAQFYIYKTGITIINEIINLLIKYETKIVYNFLKKAKGPRDIIIGQLTTQAKQLERKVEISRYQQQISKILGKCGKCGSRSLVSLQIQMRSGDEGATSFILCNNCGTIRKT